MSGETDSLTNIPKDIRAGKLTTHTPDYANTPGQNGEVNWKKSQYKTCTAAAVTEMGPKPGNLYAAISWIEQYWQKVGEGYDECKNIPVPDLTPTPTEHYADYRGWSVRGGGMNLE